MPTPSLTQGHLELLETCPRKFQHVFINGLAVPVDPEVQARSLWGSQFHLLMQQQALGLPVAVMEPVDPEMTRCLAQLRQAAPELFAPQLQTSAQSETQRTLAFNGYLLTVVYDLLLLDDRQGFWRGQIADWKTYQKTPGRDWVEASWQTRLYLYVLTETAGLVPEQVAMTYWFVRGQEGSEQPESYRFSYSLAQHDQTRQDLTRLTDGLSELRSQPADFPKVDVAKGICGSCVFAHRCDRADSPVAAQPISLDLEAVEEVVL